MSFNGSSRINITDTRCRENLENEVLSRNRVGSYQDAVRKANKEELEAQEERKNQDLESIRSKNGEALSKIEALKITEMEKCAKKEEQIRKEAEERKESTREAYKAITEKSVRDLREKRLDSERELLRIDTARFDNYLDSKDAELKAIEKGDAEIEKRTKEQIDRDSERKREELDQKTANLEIAKTNARRVAEKTTADADKRIDLINKLGEDNLKQQRIIFESMVQQHDRSNAKTLNRFVERLKGIKENLQDRYDRSVVYFVDGLDEERLGKAQNAFEKLREEMKTIGGVLGSLERKLADVAEDEETIDRRQQIKDIYPTTFDASSCLGKIIGRFMMRISVRCTDDERLFDELMKLLMQQLSQFGDFDPKSSQFQNHLINSIPGTSKASE